MATIIDIDVTQTTQAVTITAEPNEYIVNINTGGSGGGVESVTGTTVDNTDPLNPVVEVPTLPQVLEQGDTQINVWSPNEDDQYIIQLSDRLTENFFSGSTGDSLIILDGDVPFPSGSTIRFSASDNAESGYKLAFVNVTQVFYNGYDVTPDTIDLTPSDYVILKRNIDNVWVLTILSRGGGNIPHATAAGTDTYTATITGVATYADGDAYLIRFTNGNTSGCTLNINSLGAKTLYRNNDGVLIGGDIQAGAEMLCVYNSTLDAFQCIGTAPNTLLAYVTNDDTVTLTKGMVVYAFSGTGDRMTVKRASNTSDGSSAQTIGLVLSSSIAANQKGIIITQGLLDGLSILPTSTWADGDAVYLGATAGTITKVKPSAPNHLVYLGIVTTASNGSAGRMYVKVQNGYELQELHNVQAQSPSLKDTLWYDNTVSPAQWKTASIPTILGYTPEDAANKQTDLTASSTKYPTVNAVNTGLSTKENTISAGTTAQYWRGDKSWQTLDKTAVGLGNVDNTSDANKPISSATQTALNAKQNNLKTFNRTQGIYYFEEFMGNQLGTSQTSYGHVITIANGTGSLSRSAATTNRTNQQGIIQHSTGTTNTGSAGYAYGSSLYLGSGSIILETYCTIETLSNATERFQTIFGYYLGNNYSNSANGVFFSYDEAGTMFFEFGTAATPNWKCYTRSNSVTTRTNTSIVVNANQWYKLRIEINAAASIVTFFIDDTLVATHNTNIPTSSTAMSIQSVMAKTAGTTARTMLTDFFMYEEIFTNSR